MTREQILERALKELVDALAVNDQDGLTEFADVMVAARSALATPSEDGWRPASEAPDGLWMLTWREGEKHTSIASKRAWPDGDDEWCAPNGKTTVTHSTYLPPTHYFRVPPPPLPDKG